MRVLIDTSLWRGYLTGRIPARTAHLLSELLDGEAELLLHPAVLGELVLGGLSVREQQLMSNLPAAPELSSTEVLEFVQTHKLMRKGIGWVDAQLVASALLAQASLWSVDEPLMKVARSMKAAFS